jgi:PAS domain-containing protein
VLFGIFVQGEAWEGTLRMPSTAPPFGLSSILPAFDRATWLAKTLFGAMDAAIVLIDGDNAWRSRSTPGLPAVHPAVVTAIRDGVEFWVEDTFLSTQMPSSPAMDQLGVRSCFAAPIRLDNGATPGALCVVDNKPRPFDATLAKALGKLAQGIADECNRLHAAETAIANANELAQTRTLLQAFVEGAPISFAITDRDLRVLKANPRWLQDVGCDENVLPSSRLGEPQRGRSAG